jgi:hypothetical protein
MPEHEIRPRLYFESTGRHVGSMPSSIKQRTAFRHAPELCYRLCSMDTSFEGRALDQVCSLKILYNKR